MISISSGSSKCYIFHAANLKRNVLFLYECDEQTILPELETMHADLKLGKSLGETLA